MLNERTTAPAIASDLRTVCVFLGPYRNLTTLVASVLHLHPNVQVLNHAGMRVVPREHLNFLIDYTPEKFERFCDFALDISQGGERGAIGGSITHSHAFERGEVGAVFRERYGDSTIKHKVDSLVWKDPLLVTTVLRRRGPAAPFTRNRRVDIAELVAQNARLRFLMPMRNPLDCARSNIDTGMSNALTSRESTDILVVVRAILDDFVWFRKLSAEFPDRFFSMFEYEVDEALLRRLCDFLQLVPDEQWIDDALRCFRSDKHYDHESEATEGYRRIVRELFEDDPDARAKLEQFAAVAPTLAEEGRR